MLKWSTPLRKTESIEAGLNLLFKPSSDITLCVTKKYSLLLHLASASYCFIVAALSSFLFWHMCRDFGHFAQKFMSSFCKKKTKMQQNENWEERKKAQGRTRRNGFDDVDIIIKNGRRMWQLMLHVSSPSPSLRKFLDRLRTSVLPSNPDFSICKIN